MKIGHPPCLGNNVTSSSYKYTKSLYLTVFISMDGENYCLHFNIVILLYISLIIEILVATSSLRECSTFLLYNIKKNISPHSIECFLFIGTDSPMPKSAVSNITTLSLSLCGGVALLALAACGLVLCAHERAPRSHSREPALTAYNTEGLSIVFFRILTDI